MPPPPACFLHSHLPARVPPCRREAEADAATEPLLSSFLYASILSHDSFERSLAFVLANRLSDATLLSTELFEVFHSVLKHYKHVSEAALADICAVRERVSGGGCARNRRQQ